MAQTLAMCHSVCFLMPKIEVRRKTRIIIAISVWSIWKKYIKSFCVYISIVQYIPKPIIFKLYKLLVKLTQSILKSKPKRTKPSEVYSLPIFFFWDKAYLSIQGWPWTYYVAMDDLELLIFLLSPPKCKDWGGEMA